MRMHVTILNDHACAHVLMPALTMSAHIFADQEETTTINQTQIILLFLFCVTAHVIPAAAVPTIMNHGCAPQHVHSSWFQR